MRKYLLVLGLFFGIVSTIFSQSTHLVKSLTAQQFKNAIEAKKLLLIDVRTHAEFTQGHIAHALNIDLQHPNFTVLVKKATKGKPFAIYCRSGRRSKLAGAKLTALGVEIVELNNGIIEWEQQGFPLKK